MITLSFALFVGLMGPATVGEAMKQTPCGLDAYEALQRQGGIQLRSGERVDAQICQRDLDTYSISALEGESLIVQLKSPRTDGMELTMTGPGSSAIRAKRTTAGDGVSLRFVVAKSGVYYLRVTGRTPQSVPYALTAEQVSPKPTGVQPSQTTRHSLDFLMD